MASTNPPLIPRELQLGVHPGGTPREGEETGPSAMSARQKHLMHGVPERSPQGNTSELPSQRDPTHPSSCAEACKHPTTQRGVSSRWGPRARERHGATPLGLEALMVLRWGSQPPVSPPSAHGKGRGKDGFGKWGQPVCTRGGFVKGEWVGFHSLHQFSST